MALQRLCRGRGAYRLLRDGVETLEEGTIDRAAVYPRRVIEAALKRGSAALVLAHNHPNGDITPSEHDKLLTRAIVDLGRGRNRAALQLSQELVNIASRIGSPDVKAQVALPLGGALGMMGDPVAALQELESGIAAAEEAGRGNT